MNTLLVVNSSPRSNSVSRKLTRHVAEQWKQRNPEGRVIERDLKAETPAYVSEEWIQAMELRRTSAQRSTTRFLPSPMLISMS